MITKKAIGTFDAIEIFSTEYLKVTRGEKYNLIDRDGEYVSKVWYDSIEKRGEGMDVVVKGERRQYTSVAIAKRASSIESLVTNKSIFQYLNLNAVVVIAPRRVQIYGKTVTIVAEVELVGEKLYLAKDGSLYYRETLAKYEMPVFIVSHAEVERIVSASHNLSKVLNYKFDGRTTNDNGNYANIAAWTFGFGTNDTEFCSTYPNAIHKARVKPWSVDMVKLRIAPQACLVRDVECLDDLLEDMGFKERENINWNGCDHWYTAQYKVDEIGQLYKDIERIKEFVR